MQASDISLWIYYATFHILENLKRPYAIWQYWYAPSASSLKGIDSKIFYRCSNMKQTIIDALLSATLSLRAMLTVAYFRIGMRMSIENTAATMMNVFGIMTSEVGYRIYCHSFRIPLDLSMHLSFWRSGMHHQGTWTQHPGG
jgi:hypothetical protein